MFCLTDSVQVSIADDQVLCSGGDFAAYGVSICPQIAESCLDALLDLLVGTDADWGELAVAGKNLRFKPVYAYESGLAPGNSVNVTGGGDTLRDELAAALLRD